MKLRICNGEFERIMPATRELLDEILAPGSAAGPGTEITLVADDRWLSATVLPLTQLSVYLMSGGPGVGVISMGSTPWQEARQQFRTFLAQEGAHATG
jgi:hypothetical protein